ncbi:MAG: DUF4143 domain-containing protein, partial [Vicinamibacteria bacterium]
HGNVWNGSEFGRAFGVAHTTVGRYLDLLSAAFVVRQLPPWSENLTKRQRTTAPSVTPSMRIALESLRLNRLDVVHAGDRTGSLAKGMRAVALGRLLEDLEPLP